MQRKISIGCKIFGSCILFVVAALGGALVAMPLAHLDIKKIIWDKNGLEAFIIDFTYPRTGYYRAHCQGIGWLPWVSNGQTAGTTGHYRRLEAFECYVLQY